MKSYLSIDRSNLLSARRVSLQRGVRAGSAVPEGEHQPVATWHGPHAVQLAVPRAKREEPPSGRRDDAVAVGVVEGEEPAVVVDACTADAAALSRASHAAMHAMQYVHARVARLRS